MTSAAATRPYSVVRLYVPVAHFQHPGVAGAVQAGLDHDALELAARSDEMRQLLMSAEEREAERAVGHPALRTIIENGEVYVSPEQPAARLPETARILCQSLGEQMFARMVDIEALENLENEPRYMWAGSACVPISWLLMFADEGARPVGERGIIRVDLQTALYRLRDAFATLYSAALPTEILDELVKTENWLSETREGIVELDYGASSRILRADDSPRDLGIAMSALEEKDTVSAVAAYRRFDRRWRGVRDALLDDATRMRRSEGDAGNEPRQH